MRLGLIGTGKQGQRYLQEKNGGRRIVRSGSRDLDDWEGLDGVIIATHPAGHKALALKAIERGLPVLVEKPLALNLADCMQVIDAAQKAGTGFLVAHLDRWAATWLKGQHPEAYCKVVFTEHKRDYSPWLDWAPHALALLAKVGACDARNVILEQLPQYVVPSVRLFAHSNAEIYTRLPVLHGQVTPMALAVRDLTYSKSNYETDRRIYRALFSEE